MAINVALVEDDKDFRKALSMVIENDPELALAGVFTSSEEYILKFDQVFPDVVLMDINLPGMTGIECISLLKPRRPEVNYIICSVYEEDDKLFASLKNGASGYILKGSHPQKIAGAIFEVHKGGSPMSATMARKVVESFYRVPQYNSSYAGLSKREKEILEYLSKGYRYKEISDFLCISIETVRTHIRNIYEKLQVNSRTEAINKISGLTSEQRELDS